ncbi:hypothetical protein A3C91_04770 [Candidatus Azambacteria bacterium RIFCSPHIGHO2_02_FULL_52_12]|uniref:ResB-like domain-containing protein n=1 Tax=Candidatus Azambacteria bacterium RIFCSPLOWO2_01_FULL_46_25 TaxID=1797298 RepID=A0A1F5BUW0_9BACT|nr:MAG: hypothetical protein A3C91_04770 [Candidatus Azambacteria bacterium RIFCSPHIGHO2_02_FULL_52_12]OGD34382.1 MAG: hypothetical protein A2988_02540 [Candidatus Azambacteria bacterium RIFCSPLOWO2_01_FULL_46_25]OGD37340.1 MAG: hypothetical protein A2850_01345 [Candidatus Azambacteria bacterium RIFCSPHIGHO2_01_FULL_51_74]
MHTQTAIKIILCSIVVAGLCACVPPATHAQNGLFTVRPAIIDEKAKARDMLAESLTLANATDRTLLVYASVANVAMKDGAQEFLDPSQADYASSLANWIEISRGVIELAPREEKKIDALIRVNLRARPGMYHAVILFHEGPTREQAESNANGTVSVAVNVEVAEIVKEYVSLREFAPQAPFFFGFPVRFVSRLENRGDRAIVPHGEIRLYDRRGHEMATIPVNAEGKELAIHETKTFEQQWQADNGFGRYTAQLALEYGSAQTKTLQGDALFWVIPWKGVAIAFGILTAAIAGFMRALHRHYEKRILHARKRHPVIDLRK